MRLFWKLLQLLYHLLYHPFAWAYDWVAALVSVGYWTEWVRTVTPYIDGEHILELGHGPGHLQRFLLDRGLFPFGLDESAPMGHLARRNLRKSGHTNDRLVRGLAQALPFSTASFQTVVATFPSEYIVDPHTLNEIQRILMPGGRLVVLPMAWLTGRGLAERFFARLFRLTGQVVDPARLAEGRFRAPFERAGFNVNTEDILLPSSHVFVVLAQKPHRS